MTARAGSPAARLDLGSGRAIEVAAEEAGDVVTMRSRDGTCVLTVFLTDAGPILRFEAAGLQIATTRSIEIACEDFHVTARNEVRVDARDVGIHAHLGGVTVRADDDVAIDGEQVLLNSSDRPQQLSWDAFLGPRAAEVKP